MADEKPSERKELNRYETIMRVLAIGSYSSKDRAKLYQDVHRFCRENPDIAAPFESNRDIDLGLLNLTDTGAVLIEEDTGLLKLV